MLLSICIPSYNRINRLMLNINSILKSKSHNFEVVITDNCSDYDISEKLPNDTRIRIIKNKYHLDGMENILTCLNNANGQYAMLCLDKDFIDGNELDSFIIELSEHLECTCGYPNLNNAKTGYDRMHYNNEPLSKRMFKCNHPTGYLYNTKIIKKEFKETISNNRIRDYLTFPFATDLLYGRCIIEGQEVCYDSKLIAFEPTNEMINIPSRTYDKKSMWFFPLEKRKAFFIFCNYLTLLNIVNKDYKRTISNLVVRTMLESTIAYRNYMLDVNVCRHYRLQSCRIDNRQLLKEARIFSGSFIKTKVRKIDMIEKTAYLIRAWYKLLINMYIHH